MEALAGEYKDFLHRARHELLAVAEAERLAQAQGFRPTESADQLNPGDRVYAVNRGRAMILAVVGQAPLTEGSVLIAAHIDTPRIELKANPLYESEGFAMFQTTYHGGIKSYQWASVPLALVGRVNKKDGSEVNIAMGLDGEPYLVIPDLAPHVDREFRERSQREVLKAEELDPVVGSRPDASGSGDRDGGGRAETEIWPDDGRFRQRATGVGARLAAGGRWPGRQHDRSLRPRRYALLLCGAPGVV